MAHDALHARIAPRWNPTYSVLGRWMRSRTGDAWQAQAYTLLIASAVLVVGVVGSFLAWGVWGAAIAEDPLGPVALRFWWAQVGVFGLWAATTLLGWSPAVQVRVDAAGVTVRQGAASWQMPFEAIERVAPISATAYHRRYRRYTGARAFVGAVPPQLLLLESDAHCWVLGLQHDDLQAVLGMLVVQGGTTDDEDLRSEGIGGYHTQSQLA